MLLLAPAVLLVRFPFASGSGAIDGLREAASIVLVVAMGVIYAEGTRAPERTRMLKLFSLHEVLAVLLLVSVLLPLLSWTNALLLFLGPLVVFVIANHQIYGTFSAPDV